MKKKNIFLLILCLITCVLAFNLNKGVLSAQTNPQTNPQFYFETTKIDTANNVAESKVYTNNEETKKSLQNSGFVLDKENNTLVKSENLTEYNSKKLTTKQVTFENYFNEIFNLQNQLFNKMNELFNYNYSIFSQNKLDGEVSQNNLNTNNLNEEENNW